MGLNLTQKIIKEHLINGEMIPGKRDRYKDRPDADAGLHRYDGLPAV